MVCSNTDLSSTSPSHKVMVTHTSAPAVFRLLLATEPCRYKVSASNPYTVGITIGQPAMITPRWATNPARRTACSDSRSALPRCQSLRWRVRSVADNGNLAPAETPAAAGTWARFVVMASPQRGRPAEGLGDKLRSGASGRILSVSLGLLQWQFGVSPVPGRG